MFFGTLAFSLPSATSEPVEPTLRMSIAGKGVVEANSGVTMSDESFSKRAALGNLDELELSRVARERSRNLRVKLLADRVLKDRSSISATLAATARKKNVKLPGKLGLEQEALVSKLKLQPDANFDTAYVMRMREENVKAITLFEQARNNPALSHEMRAVAGEGLKILLGSQQQTLAIEVPVKTVRVVDPF
jgi:predicted outer membrane protein